MAAKRSSTGYKGVYIRANGDVRILVRYRGEWVHERIGVPATVTGYREALRIREEVNRLSEQGIITWRDYFPDSPRCEHLSQTPTWLEMAERWLKIRAADVKPSTWAGYSKRVKLWAKVFGPMKITDIRKSHIRESLVAYGWTHGKTMANALTVMRGVMELALEDELIRTNPANGIRTPRTQRKRHEPLTASEMNLVLEALESSHWLEYFQVAFSTGMRTNELCGLTWPDVNIDSGKVRIHNSRTNGQDTGSTKTATERTISLKPLALRAIKRQRLKTRGDSHVFTLPDGRPINNDQRAWRPWKAALEKAGISHRRAYETRHTFATLQLMAGAELIEVSRYLGHAKPSMTLDHYADWMDVSEQERELSKTAFS